MILPGGPRKPHIVLWRGRWKVCMATTNPPYRVARASAYVLDRNIKEGRLK